MLAMFKSKDLILAKATFNIALVKGFMLFLNICCLEKTLMLECSLPSIFSLALLAFAASTVAFETYCAQFKSPQSLN